MCKTNSCFSVARFSFNFASSASISLRKAADWACMPADSLRARIVTSVRASDRAARNRYACCHARIQWSERDITKSDWDVNVDQIYGEGAYIIQIFISKSFTLYAVSAIHKQSSCSAHQTACSRRRKCLFKYLEEPMRMEWWTLVR